MENKPCGIIVSVHALVGMFLVFSSDRGLLAGFLCCEMCSAAFLHGKFFFGFLPLPCLRRFSVSFLIALAL